MGLNYYLQIGNLLRELRREKGYTQKSFAKKINIPRSTYANYENNTREPSKEALEKIAQGFDMSVGTLLANFDFFEPVEQLLNEKRELQINNLTHKLCEAYGFKITQYGEDDIEIITPHGNEYNISFDEYTVLGKRIVNELESYAVYTKIKILEDILKEREMEL